MIHYRSIDDYCLQNLDELQYIQDRINGVSGPPFEPTPSQRELDTVHECLTEQEAFRASPWYKKLSLPPTVRWIDVPMDTHRHHWRKEKNQT